MARALMLCAMLVGLALETGVSLVPARAEDPVPQPPAPGAVVGASPNVSINGVGVARQGDATSQGGAIVTGSPNVFINGKPVALEGDRTTCNGVVTGTPTGVFINGKQVIRRGDQANCPAN